MRLREGRTLRRGTILTTLAACCLMGVAATALTRADTTPPPYELNVIVSLTGPIAYTGNEHLQMLSAIADTVNAHGGIQGHPLKLVPHDDQSNPVIAVQQANALIAQHVPVIVGPNVTATCAAVLPLVKDGPVLYCLSPAIHPARGGYVFSSFVTIFDNSAVLLRYARDRGWNKIALITATDASGQEVDRAFGQAFALPENAGVQLVDHQHFNATDLTVAAQMAHTKASNPNMLIAWTTGTSFGTLLHGIHDAELTVPIVAGAAVMIKAQLQGYGALLPAELYFGAARGMEFDRSAPRGVRDAQTAYFAALKKAGLEMSYTNNATWDYGVVLTEALRHLGPTATAAQIRDYIDNLSGFAGIQGVYDFHDAEQRGIGQSAVVVYRWESKTDRLVPVSLPGGRARAN
jgi:branched-chain amino acid transport system substrate-binding protein